MEVYDTEQEQIEAIKKWFVENGKSALLGIIFGVGTIFGWRTWQSNIIEQAEDASEIYQQSLVAMGQENLEEARDNATNIINTYGSTGYSVLARLLLAYIESQESNYGLAEEHLISALDETDNETMIKEIKLRLARVYIANQKIEQALALLTSEQASSFSAQYNELKGDIYELQGENDAARLAYQQALIELESGTFDPTLLNSKLDSLE